MAECPTCGRTDFKSELGMKQHHGEAHGESLTLQKTSCSWCGDEIERNEFQLGKCETHFCSDECMGQYRSDNHSGEDSWHWKGEMKADCEWCGEEFELEGAQRHSDGRNFCSIECESKWRSEYFSNIQDPNIVECDWCGSKFERVPSHATGHNFCSNDCHSKWQSENIVGENHPSWKGGLIEEDCAYCGNELERQRSEVEKFERLFCDKKCYGQWKSENVVEEDHPNWKGGYDRYYGPNWGEQRQKALERDGYTCQRCGMRSATHKEEKGKELNIHHITPAREFDDYEKQNNLDNLITLCSSCHRKLEGLPIDRQTA